MPRSDSKPKPEASNQSNQEIVDFLWEERQKSIGQGKKTYRHAAEAVAEADEPITTGEEARDLVSAYLLALRGLLLRMLVCGSFQPGVGKTIGSKLDDFLADTGGGGKEREKGGRSKDGRLTDKEEEEDE